MSDQKPVDRGPMKIDLPSKVEKQAESPLRKLIEGGLPDPRDLAPDGINPQKVPGLGIAKGMAFTLKRATERKATIMYPEVPANVSAHYRGRLTLLLDEHGAVKCETCFQCAQACPVECIEMGGVDTQGRHHVHWGAAETYAERRDGSAMRRSGRTAPADPAAAASPIRPNGLDLGALDAILAAHDHDPARLLEILEAALASYGSLPAALLAAVSERTGAPFAKVFGTASAYAHLRPTTTDATPNGAVAGAGAGVAE
jgi:hypothetical protein